MNVSGAGAPNPIDPQVRLTPAEEDSGPIDTSIITWEEFGETKIGGIMGLILKGAEVGEDPYKQEKFNAQLTQLKNGGLSAKAAKIIEEKVEDFHKGRAVIDPKAKITAEVAGLYNYEAHGSTYVYGTVEFTFPCTTGSVSLRVQIPTNFHPGEIRDFTNQAILKNKKTTELKENLNLAKTPEQKKAAREALADHLQKLEDAAPKKLDAESFIKIVAQSAIRDAKEVQESKEDTLAGIQIDNKPIGQWLKAAHFRMNLATGSMESIGKDHKVVALFNTGKYKEITDLFKPSLSKAPSIAKLQKRVLARQIRDDIENSMGSTTGFRAPLDAFVDEQMHALEVLMLRRTVELNNAKKRREHEKEMKDIVTIINTLRTGQREKGKPKGLKGLVRKGLELPKDNIQAGIGKLQEKLPGWIPFFSKAEYEGIRLSGEQAKTLVEAESVLRGHGEKPTGKDEETTQEAPVSDERDTDVSDTLPPPPTNMPRPPPPLSEEEPPPPPPQ